MTTGFHGIYPILYAFFDRDGRLDRGIMRAQVEACVRHGAHGLAVLGLQHPELVQADVFAQLRKFRDQGRRFDVIVLDPPKFAPTASAAERAARGYKDINLWAMKLLRPGGLLFTFSCSGATETGLVFWMNNAVTGPLWRRAWGSPSRMSPIRD